MGAKTEEIQQDIYLLKGEGKGSHNYLVRAAYRNVLIDSGLDQNFLRLQEQLLSLGLKLRDIDVVINTHEHLDHIGSNRYFQESSLIAAHRFAATKITLEDHYVTLYRSGDLNEVPLRVHLWLENRSLFDLGSHTLEVIHTPGHTSGSICIYEFSRRLHQFYHAIRGSEDIKDLSRSWRHFSKSRAGFIRGNYQCEETIAVREDRFNHRLFPI
ncbi:MAG: MBL fold metallo-hydrolase [Thermodesulfobacteriota bacterium]